MLPTPRCFVMMTIMLVHLPLAHCSIVSWLFGQKTESTVEETTNSDTMSVGSPSQVVAKSQAKFEMKSAEESFLALSQFTKDLSPLDACHHVVIAELTSTCSDMSEEQLGKLAVQLLNCQSQAEGRRVYSCTQDMTIAECTGQMDPVTWNAYQIVSNRARSVCYATKQHQFRMKTEFTVNKLVHTTQGQLEALGQIQNEHDKLSEATKDTLGQVQTAQQDLTERQHRLIQANKNVNTYIVGNIKDLTREKALIASGNKELAAMAEGLKHKLDEATHRILEQGSNQRENHDEILEDLASIRAKAKEVWEKIDNSSKDMMHYRDETKEHYHHTLANLQRINHTIAYLETTLHHTKAELESKLDWLMGLVGGTGDKVALISTLFLHAVYLLLGALSSTFLQTPRFSRLLLLALVPLNAWAQVHTKASLGFIPMTMFIILTVMGNWALTWLWYLYMKHKSGKRSLSPPSPPGNGCQIVPNIFRSPVTPTVSSSVKRTSQGLSSPDIHRLVNILENMYNSGILKSSAQTLGPQDESPLTPTRGLSITNLPTPNNPPPTPCGATTNRRTNDRKLVRRHLLEKLEDVTSTPRRRSSPAPSHSSTPIKVSPDTNLVTPPSTPPRTTGEPDIDVSVVTPSGRNLRTPRTPKVGTPRTPRSSTPNRSISRPLCLATTKSGMPCKIQSLEGSAFCHRHQVNK